jgi:uncharacterized protein YjeT (DUF2065 family)
MTLLGQGAFATSRYPACRARLSASILRMKSMRAVGLLLLLLGAIVLALAYFGQPIPFFPDDLPLSDLWIVGGCAAGLGAAVLIFMRSES